MTTNSHSQNRYAAVDDAIIGSINETKGVDSFLRDERVCAAARFLADDRSGDDVERLIDRRCQALRKAGKIVYLRKKDAPGNSAGWYLPPRRQETT